MEKSLISVVKKASKTEQQGNSAIEPFARLFMLVKGQQKNNGGTTKEHQRNNEGT